MSNIVHTNPVSVCKLSGVVSVELGSLCSGVSSRRDTVCVEGLYAVIRGKEARRIGGGLCMGGGMYSKNPP